MLRSPPRATLPYTLFPYTTLLRSRARRAIGLAKVQDRPLAVRAGLIMAHFMAHSNILPPLDHSPESHASAWPVSAWDGRRQLRSNAEWVLPADACAQGDTPRGFGMPESGDLETEMTSHRAEDRSSEEHTSELQSLM